MSKFKIYPGYKAIGIVVENDESKADGVEYHDIDKRIQVRIPEIHGPCPDDYEAPDIDMTGFTKNENLPWLKAVIPPGFSSKIKKQLYPKGYSVYVNFIVGDIERAVVETADYLESNLTFGQSTGGVAGSGEDAAFISANKGLWGVPLVQKDGTNPSDIYISSNFGSRADPATGVTKYHGGIDICCWSGTEGRSIYATRDGIVTTASYMSGGYGNYVVLDHGVVNGYSYESVYGHMKYTPQVQVGQQVVGVISTTNNPNKTCLGVVGSTGYSTGPHLHFEIRQNGTKISARYICVDNNGKTIDDMPGRGG